MSISYQPEDDTVLSVALKTQELVVRLSDSIVSVSGLDVTVDVGEAVVSLPKPVVIHCDDSVGISLIAASGVVVSGSQITATLSAAMAAADALIIKYSVVE